MTTRRLPFLLVALTAAAAALAGCGSDDKPAASASSTALNGIKVVGSDPKKAPVVTLDKKPFTVTATSTRVVTPGKGAALDKEDIAGVQVEVVNGKDGKTVNSSYETGAAGIYLGQKELLAGLKKSLPGQKVGSRLLVAVPPADGFGSQGASQIGIGANDTLLFVIDVVSSTKILPKATGTAVAPAKGLPTVVYNDGKAAAITIPKGPKPPAKSVTQPLIQGTGAAVKAGQTVHATYTGVLWRNGKVFDNAWAHDPAYFEFQAGSAQGVIPAWSKGVVGKKVGSRLLLVVAPADGYGAAGQGDIKGTDTMVFVMDILAAY